MAQAAHPPRRSLASRSLRRTLLLLFFVAALLSQHLVVGVRPARAELNAIQRGFRIEYPVPVAPLNLAVEADGKIWFTAPSDDVVGLVHATSSPTATVTTYEVTLFNLDAGSMPQDLVYVNGVVWFTQRGTSQLGRIDATTLALTSFSLPTRNSGPTGIDAAPDGTLWIGERDARKLAHFDPITEEFTEYPLPSAIFGNLDAAIRDITVLSNDQIWFTLPNADHVGAFQISLNRFFRVSTGPDTMPSHLVFVNGQPWITANRANLVGRYAPGTLTLWTYFGVRTANSAPTGLAARTNAQGYVELWYAQNNSGSVGRLTLLPNGRKLDVTEFPLFSTAARPWGLVIAPNASVWVAENGRHTITELRAPYSYTTYLPVVARR